MIQCVLAISTFSLQAQNLIGSNESEQAPFINESLVSSPHPESQTIWDVLYNYNLLTAVGANGNAAVCFTGTEFWVSRWNFDTLQTLDASGVLIQKFSIPGIYSAATGNVRSFTTDGTFLYAGVNTTSIKKIDPTTQTLAGTITAPAAVRSLTYDPTANGGAGGFWLSNFATDITLISMTGATLNTIPAIQHGLTAMYGTAFDNYTPGGPYLWVFDQAFSAGTADIVQLDILNQLQTGVFHDVITDVADSIGLAGGIFLYPSPGTLALIGLLQGTPANRLFAYDLDVAVGINEIANSENFLTVTPNPSNTLVDIFVNKHNNDEVRLQIIDVIGKVVFDKKTRGLNNYINVSKYEHGVYFVKVYYKDQIYISRLVIE